MQGPFKEALALDGYRYSGWECENFAVYSGTAMTTEKNQQPFLSVLLNDIYFGQIVIIATVKRFLCTTLEVYYHHQVIHNLNLSQLSFVIFQPRYLCFSPSWPILSVPKLPRSAPVVINFSSDKRNAC